MSLSANHFGPLPPLCDHPRRALYPYYSNDQRWFSSSLGSLFCKANGTPTPCAGITRLLRLDLHKKVGTAPHSLLQGRANLVVSHHVVPIPDPLISSPCFLYLCSVYFLPCSSTSHTACRQVALCKCLATGWKRCRNGRSR